MATLRTIFSETRVPAYRCLNVLITNIGLPDITLSHVYYVLSKIALSHLANDFKFALAEKQMCSTFVMLRLLSKLDWIN